jgi:hypothetical protein
MIIFAFFITLDVGKAHLPRLVGQMSDTLILIQLCTGMLEILMIAYYSGALTMFLVSKPNLPFRSQVEGMGNSDWKLIVASGDEYHLRNNFDQDEHPIVKLRFQEATSEIDSNERQRRLHHIFQILDSEPNHYAISTRHRISWARSLAQNKAYTSFNLIQFCDTISVQSALIFPKNSPYREAINYWLLKLNDAGLSHHLKNQFGTLGRGDGAQKATAITMEQMSLVVRLGTIVLLIVIAIWIVEKISHKGLSKKWSTGILPGK